MALENIYNIREGDLIPGTEQKDPTGVAVVYAKYWRRAKYEAERLVENENNATYKSGLFEIKAFQETPQVYAPGRPECFDLPDGLQSLPETNQGLISYLRQRWIDLQSKMTNVPQQFRPVILDAVQELIQATEVG
jgi:hypothetical protein